MRKIVTFSLIFLVTGVGSALADCYEDWQNAPGTESWHKIRANCVWSIGQTIERKHHERVEFREFGRAARNTPISVLRVSDRIRSANAWLRPSILIVANTHPGEASPARSVLDWLVYALENSSQPAYPGGPSYNQLFATRQFWIVPYHSQDSSTRCNENFVNLNREYGFLWRQENGVAPYFTNNCSESGLESGPVPFSQPESRALAGLLKVSQPAVYLSVHGSRTPGRPTLSGEPCLLPLIHNRVVAGELIGDNWIVSRSSSLYNWNGTKYVSSGSQRGTAGSYLTNPASSLSLPRLSELEGPSSGNNIRLYSPYSAADVCDNRSTVGVANARRQTISWAWVSEGALSVLLEHLGPGLFQPEADLDWRFWSRTVTEESVQNVSKDVRAPIGRLGAIAPNPLEDADTVSVDLAVEKLTSPFGSCNSLELFSSNLSYGSIPENDLLVGQYGDYRPRCDIRHWGNSSAAVTAEIKMLVTDLDQPSLSVEADFQTGPLLAGETSKFLMPNYSFLKGRRYEVSCNIISSDVPESDPDQTVTVVGDQGCLASGGSESYCIPSTGSSYDSTFPTNNARSFRFTADVSKDLLCPNGKQISVNVNGSIFGALLPAIF